MNGRDESAEHGAARIFFSAPIVLAGLGFTLAFGWLWFPVLRDTLLPGLFKGHDFRPAVFGLALMAGFTACGFALQKLKRFAAGRTVSKILPAILVHGFALALLVPAFFALQSHVGWLPELSMGLGAAWPGVWWTARIVALGPARAVAALAFAAGTACLVYLGLRPAFGLLPNGPGSGFSITPLPLSSGASILVVAAGLVTAFGLACLAARNRAPRNDAEARRNNAALPPRLPSKAVAVSLGVAAALFFGLGCLNVFDQSGVTPQAGSTASAIAPGIAPGITPGIALVCGLALAAFILNRQGVALSVNPGSGRPAAPQFGASAPASLSLALLSLGLPFLSGVAPLWTGLVFGTGEGLVQAAGLALCAAVAVNERPHAAFMAGMFLLLTLAAVNAGYLAGLGMADLLGKAGPAALVLVLAGLTALPMAYPSRKRAAEREKPGPPSMATGEIGESETAAKAGQMTDIPSPVPAEQLTEKEKALALLLVNGYSNKAVAEVMGLTENTVRWHIKKLNRKTGASNRGGLIAILRGERES